METAFRIAIGAIDLLILGAMPYVLYLALHAPLKYLRLWSRENKTSGQKIWGWMLLGATFIGFFVCIYQGALALLWWLPHSWTDYDADSDTVRWVGDSLAGLYGLGGALLLFGAIAEQTKDKHSE